MWDTPLLFETIQPSLYVSSPALSRWSAEYLKNKKKYMYLIE